MRKTSFILSRKTLAWFSVLALLISLLPLCIIAFYNHPYYEDFGFSLLTRKAWLDTGRFGAVISAAVKTTINAQESWGGAFITTFISALQPAIFGEGMYWITTVLLLALFLFSLWVFIRQAMRALRVDLPAFLILYSLLSICMIQLIPKVSVAFFWFSGGVASIFPWSVMLLNMAAWLRFSQCTGKVKTALLFTAMVILSFILAGGSYATALFACLCAMLYTLRAFWHKHPKRGAYLSLMLLLTICLVLRITMKGNLIRDDALQGGMGVPAVILQSLLLGLALMADWLSLPLAAVMILMVTLLLPALRQSMCTFSRPLWVTMLIACLFCAQVALTQLAGNDPGDGYALNTCFFTCVLMAHGLVLYWAGWFLRKAETPSPASPEADTARRIPTSSPRVRGGILAVVAALLIVGFISHHPERACYGLQYMPSGSAMSALQRGGAERHGRRMAARNVLLNDPSQPDVMLKPLPGTPMVFISGLYQDHDQDEVIRLYAEYYQKTSVSLTP